jgi:flagellar biosynthesis protein FlhF
MKMRKFTGATMKEIVARVKREMGPDAMIVATRTVRKGILGTQVEVTAALDVQELPASLAGGFGAPLAPTLPPAPTPEPTRPDPEALAPLYSELKALRSELRPLYNGVHPGDVRTEMEALKSLLEQASMLRDRFGMPDRQALTRLARKHRISAPSRKKVVALVGPTGVGKTTTVAKLAARRALLEGKQVALVTLDTYRVGGEEQIQRFAELIECPLFTVRDPSQLAETVGALAGFDSIYIDTAGRSWQAERDIRTTMDALHSVRDVEIHLALAADTRPSQVDRWFDRFGGENLSRILFTKVDEAEWLTELVEAPARLSCPISYLTVGQRVPEDLVQATDGRLLAMACEGAGGREEAA